MAMRDDPLDHLDELHAFLVATAGVHEHHVAAVVSVFHKQEVRARLNLRLSSARYLTACVLTRVQARSLDSCIAAFQNRMLQKPLYKLFLAAGVRMIPADTIGRALVPERVELWRQRVRPAESRPQRFTEPSDAQSQRIVVRSDKVDAKLIASATCEPPQRRCRQTGGHGKKECRELARPEAVRGSSPYASWPEHPPKSSSGHAAVSCKGSTEGMTQWEAASDAIMGEFGERNKDWRNKDWRKTTTQVLYISEHEGERQAVSTAVYTHTNDCAIVVSSGNSLIYPVHWLHFMSALAAHQVHLFATHKDCRRSGHGRKLLRLLEEHAVEQGKALLIECVRATKQPEY
eukprot:COSAG02_NODE_2080_length_9901_cov_103.580086_5_plen_346_part_00